MKPITIILTDDEYIQSNIDLIRYINDNLYKILQKDYIFEFEIANYENKHIYDSRHIVNFPTLLLENKQISGLFDITNKLNTIINQKNKNKNNNNNNTSLQDFMDKEINKMKNTEGKISVDDDSDKDSDADFSKKIHTKMQQMIEKKKLDNKPKSKPQPNHYDREDNIQQSQSNNMAHELNDSIKKMPSGNKDDELLKKFFENKNISS